MLLAFTLALQLHAAEVVMTVAADGSGVQPAPPAEPISIDVVDADIRSVLRLFGEHAGINFVLDDTVKATVTCRLVDVPWDEALAAILAVEGLAARPVAPAGPPPAVWVVEPAVE